MLGLAVILSVTMLRRRRNIWRRFARAHNFRYHSGHPENLKVTGSIQNRQFQLMVLPDQSDTGALGIEVVRMSLEVRGNLPRGLRAVNVAGVVRQVETALEEVEFATDDPEFDESTLVRGEVEPELRAYFTPARRQAFLALLDPDDLYEVQLTDRWLSIQERELVSDRQQLEDNLAKLLQAVSAFDV